MAAAGARAAWQRANRCFVQEDAKRAPKIACCSSTQQNDVNVADTAYVQDQCVSSMSINFNFMNCNVPSDTKWWLQTQPGIGYHKDFIYERLKGFSNEHMKSEETSNQDPFTDGTIHDTCIEGKNKKAHPESYSETLMEHISEAQIQEMKEVNSCFSQPVLNCKVDSEAFYFQQKCLDSAPIDYLDLEIPWERSNKYEPWWRVLDKEELASYVAQKSLENIENCDLPKPAHICRNPFTCLGNWESNRYFSGSFGCNVDIGLCHPIDKPEHKSGLREMGGKYWHSDHVHCHHTSEHLASDTWTPNIAEAAESLESQKPDSGRTKLLEALRLSQTRARNAEMAAQKAYDEKEHIVKLLLKQASHLFAYKQWLQLLQLESLFLRPRLENHQVTSTFPARPWMPLKAAKGRSNTKRKPRKRKKCWLCKYAFLIAVGLGLAGAGIFLGYCLGWMSGYCRMVPGKVR